MKYTIEQLADIIDGDRGKNYPKQNEFLDKGYCLFLNTGNVTAEGFSFETNQFITEEKDRLLNKGKLQRGDIVYTTRGTVGNAAFYSNAVPYENIRINSGMVILRCDNEVINNSFLYQILKSAHYRHYFMSFCTGTAQPQLPIKNLKNIIVDIPARIKQDRIANCLSAYDDLIENNQKKIKLLEEAAQRLYKEWFVDLRFPGYEDVQIVDGVPEGWKKTTIENKCTLKKTIVHPEETQTGTAYIGLEHIPRHDFCLSNWGDASEVSSNKYIYNQKDIIFGQIRPYFHKVGFAINDGVASTDSFIMKPDERCWGLFLLTVSSDAFVQFAYQTCKEGAKMPRADWRQMKEYPLLIPGASLLCRFETFVAEITDKIRTIVLQNRYLTEARNRLLPKLMSGEIEL